MAMGAVAAGCAPLPRQLRFMPATQLLRLRSSPGLAIIDVRDEDERMYDGHIAGSLHYASATFDEKLPELLQVLSSHKVVVFHCALSQVRGPTCAKAFMRHLDSLSTTNAPEVFVLEKGFNGWAAYGHPSCSCKEIRCSILN